MRGKRPDEGAIRLLRVYVRLFLKDECFTNGKGGALKLTSLVLDAHESRLAESARRYHARLSITDETQVAVLIQELVPAEVAGVLFTCDPLSGRRDRWIVEASWGLGEAVVEGLVTPDRYTLTSGGALLVRQLGSKEMAILPDAQGGTRQHPVSDPARGQQACLDEEALARLAALGAACEQLFGPGQDIEWTWCCSKLFLLQCRPVTRGGNP